MKTITRAILVSAAMLMGSATAQAGKLDAFMPGEMVGMEMTKSVFEAFFTDGEGKVARSSSEFMAMYSKMDARDKAIVRIACTAMDVARAGFSDRISSACRAAGL